MRLKRVESLFRNSCRFLPRAFSLIELLLVIVVITVIFASASRFYVYLDDAEKYRKTIETLIAIKRALVGDERLNNLGTRADFGYLESFATPCFPDAESGDIVPVTTLANYLPPCPKTATYNLYKLDGWGHNLFYTTNWTKTSGSGFEYTYVQIMSYGKDGASGGSGVFDADFHILIRKDLYEDTSVIMNIVDVNGTVLRGPVTPWDHQIYFVAFRRCSDELNTYTTSSEITYGNGLFTIPNGVRAGYYRLYVRPTTGGRTDARGLMKHSDELPACGQPELSQVICVYPKDKGTPNFIEFRFPGAVDTSEL